MAYNPTPNEQLARDWTERFKRARPLNQHFEELMALHNTTIPETYEIQDRMFREFRTESIHEFLQRTRLDQARQLLCDERLAVKEVSARLNFSSEFYFSRFFRKHTGMSPRQFRESISD